MVDINLTFDMVMTLEQEQDIKLAFELCRQRLVLNVIDNGFLDDKSFSKWYLDKYIPSSPEVLDQISDTSITITLDHGPLGSD